MLSVSVNANNRITNSGFSYDAAGNLLNDGSASYSYDLDNRLTSTAGVTYTYDGDGNRVKKSNGTLYWLGLCAGTKVLLETDLSGNTLREFVFFAGRRVARRDNSGSVYYFFSDHLGSAKLVTNATGSVVEDSDFYPFGGERVFVDSLDNNFKFTGHVRDPESGLDQTLFRSLASSRARWQSPDPVMASPTEPQSLNRYAYVVNNPTNLTDPTGLFHFSGGGGGDDFVLPRGPVVCWTPPWWLGWAWGAPRFCEPFGPIPSPFAFDFGGGVLIETWVERVTYTKVGETFLGCEYTACTQAPTQDAFSACNSFTKYRWQIPDPTKCPKGFSQVMIANRVVIQVGDFITGLETCRAFPGSSPDWLQEFPCVPTT